MTVLRGITWEHARGYGSVVAASTRYEIEHPGIRIEWDYRSLQAFADRPLSSLVQDYDLLVIDHPHIPGAAEDGLLAELDGCGFDDQLDSLAGQSVGRSHESYQHRGHQYGLATDAAAQVAAFRPDLIAEPPRDWPAVLDLAREGRVLWPAKPIDAYSSLVTLAANHGAPAMGEPGLFLTDEQAAPALELLHRLAESVPVENLEANPIVVADALAEGDRWAYAPLLFGYTNYSRRGFRSNRLQYIDIPIGPQGVAGSLLGGAGIAVSRRSAHRDLAIAFAFWLDEPDTQRGSYFDGGGQPGNSVAWDDDRTNSETLEFFRGTRATLEGAYLRPRYPWYIELQDELSPLVTDAMAGRLDDRALIRRLNDAVARKQERP